MAITRQKGDTYARQLQEGHEKRFDRYITEMDTTVKNKLGLRKLYKATKEFLKDTIYQYYDVDIKEFTMAMLQGKLHLVALQTDHSDPLQSNT